jgi:hypothetical protein
VKNKLINVKQLLDIKDVEGELWYKLPTSSIETDKEVVIYIPDSFEFKVNSTEFEQYTINKVIIRKYVREDGKEFLNLHIYLGNFNICTIYHLSDLCIRVDEYQCIRVDNLVNWHTLYSPELLELV